MEEGGCEEGAVVSRRAGVSAEWRLFVNRIVWSCVLSGDCGSRIAIMSSYLNTLLYVHLCYTLSS